MRCRTASRPPDDVVHRHRRERVVLGLSVDQDHGNSVAPQAFQPVAAVGDRGQQDPADPLLKRTGRGRPPRGRGPPGCCRQGGSCPSWPARSSAPRAMSVKNGLRMSSTTRPMLRLRPARSWRAASLRTNPRLSMAARTRFGRRRSDLVGPVQHRLRHGADGDRRDGGDVAHAHRHPLTPSLSWWSKRRTPPGSAPRGEPPPGGAVIGGSPRGAA